VADHDDALRALEDERDQAVHAVQELFRLVAHLRGLVARSFEEGFRARDPDSDEPWLIDWLASEARQELDRLVPRRAHGEDPEA